VNYISLIFTIAFILILYRNKDIFMRTLILLGGAIGTFAGFALFPLATLPAMMVGATAGATAGWTLGKVFQ